MVNTIEYIDVKLKCTPENYMIILTNVTPINLIKKKKKEMQTPGHPNAAVFGAQAVHQACGKHSRRIAA